MGKRTTRPLTSEFCKKAERPAAGSKVYRCAITRGLALRVTATGNRAFLFCYSAPDHRERRMTIGQLGPWTLTAARNRVQELRHALDRGRDPLAERIEIGAAPCLRNLWCWYSGSALLRLGDASQRDIARVWTKFIAPILGPRLPLKDLRRADVQRLVDLVAEGHGTTSANRCHSYLRRMLNLAVADGWIETNVATKQIHRHQEHGRQRYLSEAEIGRLRAAIDIEEGSPAAAAIKVLLLTGARRSEVLGMRWSELDLSKRVWTKPPSRTKQRRVHIVPVTDEVVRTVLALKSAARSEFVFPGTGRLGHLSDVKSTWRKLCEVAQISDCRMHDLRHSFASVLVSNGVGLPVIGSLLGHSQASTTMRYAHLFDGPLRAAAEFVSRAGRVSEVNCTTTK